MLVNITINDKRTTMWFFRDENYNINLNFLQKGPAQIDFSNLSTSNQEYIIKAIQLGNIVVDKSIADLLEVRQKEEVKEEEYLAEIPEVKKYVEKTKENKQRSKKQEELKKIDEQMKKQREKAEFIIKQGLRGIKNALKKEDNIAFIDVLIMLEKTNKQRSTVLDYLSEKKKKIAKKKPKKKNNKQRSVRRKSIYDSKVEYEEEGEELTFYVPK